MASIGPPDRTTSNISNIYHDGGGGGRINGKDILIFSDGIYTDGAVPNVDNTAHWRNFTSNSIALSGCNSDSVNRLCDFGTAEKGPFEQIPYFPDEDSQKAAIWPNQGIATLCDGTCGVSFPVVVNRTESAAGRNGDLYNTGIKITLSGDRPVVERLTRSLFVKGEPLYGSFGTLVGVDGYLYMFASITHLDNGVNGLRMARVPQGSWSVRGAYQFWSGTEWTAAVPAYDDDGKANIFHWSESLDGVAYGPGTRDLFFSPYYGCHILLFMSDTPATDANVYLSYNTGADLSKGWSTPKAIYTMPPVTGGYNYAFHAYGNYDPSGKVVPISWSRWSSTESYSVYMANVDFS